VGGVVRSEGGEFVGYDADVPTGRVGGGVVVSEGEGFGGSVGFVAGAKGTCGVEVWWGCFVGRFFVEEVGGAFAAVGGEDGPSVEDEVVAILSHGQTIPFV